MWSKAYFVKKTTRRLSCELSRKADTHLRKQYTFLRLEKGGAGEGSEEMEPASLASLVESTFVMAAAGNSYQEGLKAFIATVKEAYERGYTVPALTMETSFVPTKVCCCKL